MPIDISDADVYAAVIAFLRLIVPTNVEIRQGQQNRVPMPSAQTIVLTALGADRIGTNTDDTAAVLTNGTVTGFRCGRLPVPHAG